MDHTARWTVDVFLFEHPDVTTARAVLDTGANTLTGIGTARRNPVDPAVPEIGGELAAGRALADLGQQLTDAASDDVEVLSRA